MSFTVDKQTLDDLNLLGKHRPHSVYSLFNKVQTTGGEKVLETMFRHPLSDPGEINQRSRIFQYFAQRSRVFPFSKESIAIMEEYLGSAGDSHILSAIAGAARKKWMKALIRDEAYTILHRGLVTVTGILNGLSRFLHTLQEEGTTGPYSDQILLLEGIFADKRLEGLQEENLSWSKMGVYDNLFGSVLREQMGTILKSIYLLDVYIAVGSVAREKGFSYARALPEQDHLLSVVGLRHPGLDLGVTNDLSLHADSNMLFLTGANMAGKSTFMKAFGIAVYLAHMGFPVAAKEMVISVRDGIYSSINLPDDLSLGYSHFYAEVLRVKKVAALVSEGENLVVIFDELFKGTNVKDAYDATLAVTEAFSAYRNCFFIISTHITEVGEKLRERLVNLQFAYLPTVMAGRVPGYTYRFTEGITNDRHGMMIIENEGIINMIHSE